jgi:type I restriction enzyme R subunit
MKPEEKARQNIDQLLEKAGWKIQDSKDLNLSVSIGVETGLYGFWHHQRILTNINP